MLHKIPYYIDLFNKKQGKITSLLVLPLLFVVIYGVIMRYVFNSPMIWGFEAITFLYGIHYMFGLSYTDQQNCHVKVDIFTSFLPLKKQEVLSVITTLVLFLPVISCLFYYSLEFALISIKGLELNSTS